MARRSKPQPFAWPEPRPYFVVTLGSCVLLADGSYMHIDDLDASRQVARFTCYVRAMRAAGRGSHTDARPFWID